jgi:hypothetical protein
MRFKKREIEFDFAKWGQDGVIILTDKGNEMLTFHKKPKSDSLFYGVDEYGYLQSGDKTAFKMFEDIKPREFWMNLYSNGMIAILDSKEQADDVGRSFIFVNPDKRVETIKVREVLD